jgi:hypothetical protein
MVFEGDIVSMHQFDYEGGDVAPSVTGAVEWQDDVAAFGLRLINPGRGTDLVAGDWFPIANFYGLHEESWTVLGNIHENPELLAVKA